METRRAEQRRAAVWQAEVKEAEQQTLSRPRDPSDAGTNPVHLFPDVRLPVPARNYNRPAVVLPEVGESDEEALRLQARYEAWERRRLQQESAAERRQTRSAHGSQRQRVHQRLQAAQESRRQDQARLEAAQESRRQDQARLEAAQESRRQDQARLEAAQESRRHQH